MTDIHTCNNDVKGMTCKICPKDSWEQEFDEFRARYDYDIPNFIFDDLKDSFKKVYKEAYERGRDDVLNIIS